MLAMTASSKCKFIVTSVAIITGTHYVAETHDFASDPIYLEIAYLQILDDDDYY